MWSDSEQYFADGKGTICWKTNSH